MKKGNISSISVSGNFIKGLSINGMTGVKLITLVLLLFALSGAKTLLADGAKKPLSFPYFADFERPRHDHDDEEEDDEDEDDDKKYKGYKYQKHEHDEDKKYRKHKQGHHKDKKTSSYNKHEDDNKRNAHKEWETEGKWRITSSTKTAQASYSGIWHLNSNPKLKRLKKHHHKKRHQHDDDDDDDDDEEREKYKHVAQLKRFIAIPADVDLISVRYWQRLALDADNIAEVQYQLIDPAQNPKGYNGGHKGRYKEGYKKHNKPHWKKTPWQTLKSFTAVDNTASYVEQRLLINHVQGKLIKVRFLVKVKSHKSRPMWAIDDVLIDKESDLDGDGIPDDIDPDRDGDGINNDYEIQLGFDPDDPNSTPPDLDGDGIPDALDSDRDGDGVDNDQDSYPDDPTRSKLTAVTGVSSTQQERQVVVSWQAHGEAIVQGYNVYRADFGQANWSALNTSPVAQTSFIDNHVISGKAYQYRVSALDNRNIEGIFSTPVNQFVIYNSNIISAAHAQWENYLALLSWGNVAQDNEIFRIYRLANNTRSLVYEGKANQFIDNASHWNQDQSYEIVSVLSFNNPLTSLDEQAEGAAHAVQLAALAPIELSLNDITLLSANQYQLESPSGVQMTLTGGYANAIGPVQLTLSSPSAGNLLVNSDNGQFQFVLRNVAHELLTLVLTENGAPPDRGVSLSINVIEDQTPLTINLDAPASPTQQTSIEISGQVINADNGVALAVASSDRFAGQEFALVVGDNQRFFGEIPLKTGDNRITVNARGVLGQTDQAELTVVRQASESPSVVFTSHQNNALVNTATINLQGRIYTTLQADQLQMTLAGQRAVITSLQNQEYAFVFNNVALNLGANRLQTVTRTPVGDVEQAITLHYQDLAVQTPPALQLQMTSPLDGQVVKDSPLIVRGQLLNATNEAFVTVNGQATPLFGDAQTGLLFSYGLDITGVGEGALDINISAGAQAQATLSKVIQVNVDRQEPVIVLDNVLQLPPAVNSVEQTPYRISGTVTDAHLASFSINGQGLVLQPSAGANSYRFDTALRLAAGQQTSLSLLATDAAGNQAVQSYDIAADLQVNIDVLQPLDNAEFLTTGDSHSIEFITRINNAPAGSQLIVRAGSVQQSIAVAQEIISGNLLINTADNIEQLEFEVRDSTNVLLSRSTVALKLVNQDTLPLQLIKTNPERNATGREPHHPIQFFFNKPVNLADLSISVKETVHGFSYSATIPAGARFEDRYKGDVFEVNKDQATVPGALSLLPGGRIVEFYPDADISFGARVFVQVAHQGDELARFVYTIRANPTFITAAVLDQAGQVLDNIEISLPELGLRVVTDNNGTFTFGVGLAPEKNIPAGLYRLVINPGGRNPDYGQIEKMLSIQSGRMNDVGTFKIPKLDPRLNFNNVRSGQSQNILASGDLMVDTSNARLLFPDGSDSGNVHAQILQIASGIYQADFTELTPHWMFNLQTGPIRINGDIGVTFVLPSLYGSHDYVPANGTPVLLMGLDESNFKITPIGVGVINNKTVTSQGRVQATRLDFLGVNLVAEEDYPLLQDYLANKISLQQLKALLITETP